MTIFDDLSPAEDLDFVERLSVIVNFGNEVTGFFLEDLSGAGWGLDARRRGRSDPPPPFVSARGVDISTVAAWWDKVALTDAEERVTECLRLVSAVERVALVEPPGRQRRTVLVKLADRASPEPLRSLGDGLSRMFWIALALENARSSGLLLIDEIENGIHYSLLPDLWNFISRAAAQYGVQVVATTHSTDCVRAFSGELEQGDDRVLVKLARRRPDTDITATTFDRAELATATQSEIELR